MTPDDGVLGVGLSALDSTYEMDTCGPASFFPRLTMLGAIRGFVGEPLSTAGRYALLDASGAASSVPRVPNLGVEAGDMADVSDTLWGRIPTTPAGETYRPCWCRGDLFVPQVAPHEELDI